MILIKARLLALAGIILLIPTFSQVKAQTIELTPFFGYETGGSLYTSSGYLRVTDGMNFGGAIDYTIRRGSQIEFSYNHLSSTLNLDEGYNEYKLCDIGINYYSIGGLQELRPGHIVVPYFMGSMGWVNYRPSDTYRNENLMHLSLAGGVKIFANDRIGLRLQARFLMPVWYNGVFFAGGTEGNGVDIHASVAAVQGDFTAAIIFKFGD